MIEQFATADDGTPLHWRIDQPAGNAPFPWVILIHGGHWNSENPGRPFTVCGPDLLNAGYFIASIEHRLAPPNRLTGQISAGRYPDQDHDIELAVAAAKSDPRCNGKVFVVGGSSGGSHAMRLAGKGLVDACIALSPATQFDDPASLQNGKFSFYVNNYAPGYLAVASPNTVLVSDEPPILIASFTIDNIPAPQYTLGKSRLDAIGAAYESILLPGAGHSFDAWPQVKAQVIAFLNEHREGVGELGVGIMYLTPSYKITNRNPPDISGAWNNACSGVALRTQWSRLQPREDYIDWAYLDASVAAAKAHNKKVSISIIAGLGTPDWLYLKGAAKFMVTTQRKTIEPMPLPWDSVFQHYWESLVKQVGARYGNDIVYVVVGGPGRKQESYLAFTDEDMSALDKLGGLPEWIEGTKLILDTYAQAFPKTAFLLATGAPYGGTRTKEGIAALQAICDYGAAKYPGKFAVGSFGLWLGTPTNNSIGAKEVQKLSPTSRVGYQMLKTAHDPVKLKASLDRGISFGAHWIEVYAGDFKDPSCIPVISAANTAMI